MNKENSRIYFLDALRGILLLLGLLIHCFFIFIPIENFWFLTHPEKSKTIGVLAYVIHVFRIPAFFMIAGFFGNMIYKKRGVVNFLVSKYKRIVIPLITTFLLTYISLKLINYFFDFGERGTALWTDFVFPENITLYHLWFLYELLFFYILSILGIFVLRKFRLNFIYGYVNQCIKKYFNTPIFLVGASLCTALIFSLEKGWFLGNGFNVNHTVFVNYWSSFIIYYLFFLVGWLLYNNSAILFELRKKVIFYGVVFLLSTISSLFLLGFTNNNTNLHTLFIVIYTITYSTIAWSGTFFCFGFAQIMFSKKSKLIRFLADSSYWVYLVHLPIVFFLQAVTQDLGLSIFSRFIFTFVPTVVISFGTYIGFVYIKTNLKKIL